MNINHIEKLYIFSQYIECLKILLYVMQKTQLFNYIVLIFLQLMMIPLIGLLGVLSYLCDNQTWCYDNEADIEQQ